MKETAVKETPVKECVAKEVATPAKEMSTPAGKDTPTPAGKDETPGSIMERPRPKGVRRKAGSASGSSDGRASPSGTPDSPALPRGLRPQAASVAMSQAEKEGLRQQAFGQADQFEVLGAKEVAAMSRELRALDERCEYLRKTYKSLRAGRQKLHGRLIGYLKSETLVFSREGLLRQQEALLELDRSIDDWIFKLERAENRRLRLRQKILEHVAAAMALNTLPEAQAQATPPGSPVRVISPAPLRIDRRGVESIKVYADGQVLSLFSDIEQAVNQMCEAVG
ncbi:hypothetical protein EJ06DRAFT_525426 [Trichodelitschia bisporula]|uniref:Up-regulated during septation protein 1 domain-containing protein n=1 Tax=Trichodelitschia bisporula TaxID=703511 RepID=A0A6G1I9R5_9PEZI|nr:hypothetical protein EJ06DRAFT_525426 [Trichodelitschia bisporula]